MKRGIIIADNHAGSVGGLHGPGFQQDDMQYIQKTFWDWFTKNVDKYGPYDFLIGVGDFTDGEGKKGSLGTLFTDIRKQADAAELVLTYPKVNPKYMYLVRGTAFHTTGASEYEDKIADDLGCSIKDVQKIEIEGWKIHIRHVAGRSDVAYGQGTPLIRELARLEYEAFIEEKEAPDIIIRGHVHYALSINRDGRLVISSPCLCLPVDSSNGRRYMAWMYTVGFGVLELYEDREPIYYPVVMPIRLIHEGKYLCAKW